VVLKHSGALTTENWFFFLWVCRFFSYFAGETFQFLSSSLPEHNTRFRGGGGGVAPTNTHKQAGEHHIHTGEAGTKMSGDGLLCIVRG